MTRTVTNDPVLSTAGAIDCPAGFSAAGVSCGIKASGNPDLALILCHEPVEAAAVFTQNIVCGAPITI